MPNAVQCSRCGRLVDAASANFIYWEIRADGTLICPGCLTPVDKIEDDSRVLTDSADDELLRDLDPDNDEGREDGLADRDRRLVVVEGRGDPGRNWGNAASWAQSLGGGDENPVVGSIAWWGASRGAVLAMSPTYCADLQRP
jgi:hypothetical protein